MADYARARAVKKAAQPGLLLLSGVHAVAVGPKRVNDRPTGEPSVMVFVARKLPLSELAPGDVVPAEIDGVKTDVVEMAVPRLHAPTDTSRPRPVLGGVATQAKGALEYGTLGCFALTQDAQPKVVAITCQHVVAPLRAANPSDVVATTVGNPGSYTITFALDGPNAAGSLIIVKMGSVIDAFTAYNAYWTVTASDTAETIASNVMTAVNSIAGSGVSAAIGPTPDVVVITTAGGSSTEVKECAVYAPLIPDSEVKLLAAVAGNVITLTGQVAGDYCVYVSWNTDGSQATGGAFTPLPKGTPVTSVPGLIAGAVTALNVSGITATSTATTATIAGAAQVSCIITRDSRVGQPTDSFSSNCSLCCSDEMGRVLVSRIDLDTALVQVRRGMQYLNEVKGDDTIPIGNTVITGVHPITDADISANLAVHKRGAKTLYTSGTVIGGNAGGYTTDSGEAQDGITYTVFYRFYDNAVVVQGDDGTRFSDRGDSGAAAFDAAGGVVGIVFGGSNKSLVTPIELITSELKITVATSTALNQTQTVTDAQGAPAVVLSADDETIKRVLTTQAEIAATPAGRRYGELIGRHAEEVQDLVNNNLRVAVVWHRNSGPAILRAALGYIGQRDERLPQEIDGVPLTERLNKIRDSLIRYGSAELSADLACYGPELLALTGLSYAEALERLRANGAGVG
jgi:hypothetical protein